MTLTNSKTLGQIGYDAIREATWCPYEDLDPEAKAVNEKMAKAVAERCALALESRARDYSLVQNNPAVLALKEGAHIVRSLINGGEDAD